MRRKARKTVGILGLGIIGARVATGLRGAGFQTYVWNRTPKPVPNFLASAAEVAGICEIIQLFVSDAAAVMEVLETVAPKLTPEHVVICSATIGPDATLEAAKFVEDRGARFLDAPFTGSKLAAERAQLVYYVGGDDATFLRARPILEASSKAIVRAGGVGDAALLKVVTNQIAAVSIQALAEATAMVKKAGLPLEALASALEQNACRSGTMDLKLPKMLHGDFEPHFSLKHMFKDVQLGIHLANSLDLDTPATAVTGGILYGAIKRGWGELDFSAIYKLYEDGLKEDETAPLLGPGTKTPDPAEDIRAELPKDLPAAEKKEGDETPADAKDTAAPHGEGAPAKDVNSPAEIKGAPENTSEKPSQSPGA